MSHPRAGPGRELARLGRGRPRRIATDTDLAPALSAILAT